MSETTRRGVLAGAAGVGAASVLAACGGSTDSDTGSSGGSDPQGGQTSAGGQTQGGQQGGTSIKTSDIPVGSGKIFKDQAVVVTQPAAGEFKAFSAKCPHQGCLVASVSNGTITCPCHQSKFSTTDGSVKGGPAPSGLAAKTVTVSGDSITVG
jgi:Rieske Fe-S protein